MVEGSFGCRYFPLLRQMFDRPEAAYAERRFATASGGGRFITVEQAVAA